MNCATCTTVQRAMLWFVVFMAVTLVILICMGVLK